MSIEKKILIDYLKQCLYKLENDECTASDINSLASTVQEKLDVFTTEQSFANYTGQSISNVRNNISRKLLDKDKPPRLRLWKWNVLRKLTGR